MKCSRCGAKCRVTVTVAEPKTSSDVVFLPLPRRANPIHS